MDVATGVAGQGKEGAISKRAFDDTCSKFTFDCKVQLNARSLNKCIECYFNEPSNQEKKGREYFVDRLTCTMYGFFFCLI